MARITVEDCLRKVDNRFGLIHLTAKRVRQLRKGAEPLVVCKNKDIVVSLREIAAGKVFQTENEEGHLTEENEIQALGEAPEQANGESRSQEQGEPEETPEGN